MTWPRIIGAAACGLVAATLAYRASRPHAVERVGDWVLDSGGAWLHRPWWKVAVNSTLRALQPWRRRLVVVSRCSDDGDPPEVFGYGLGLVRHRDVWWLPQTIILAYLAYAVVTLVRG